MRRAKDLENYGKSNCKSLVSYCLVNPKNQNKKTKIEILCSGCPACNEVAALVWDLVITGNMRRSVRGGGAIMVCSVSSVAMGHGGGGYLAYF